jgi:hypothetical protein
LVQDEALEGLEQREAIEMNISIFPENGEWLLVLDPAETNLSESQIGSVPPSASAFERCWTGDQWAKSPDSGKRFESKLAAAAYLKEHWDRMERQRTHGNHRAAATVVS